jgi:hypothetical protein
LPMHGQFMLAVANQFIANDPQVRRNERDHAPVGDPGAQPGIPSVCAPIKLRYAGAC